MVVIHADGHVGRGPEAQGQALALREAESISGGKVGLLVRGLAAGVVGGGVLGLCG